MGRRVGHSKPKLACRPLDSARDPQDLSQPPASRHADHATETRRQVASTEISTPRGTASEDTRQQPAAPRDTHRQHVCRTPTPRALFLVPMQERRTDTLDETAVVSIQKWGLCAHLCRSGAGRQSRRSAGQRAVRRGWGGRGAQSVLEGLGFSRCWGASLVLGPGRPFRRVPASQPRSRGQERGRCGSVLAARSRAGAEAGAASRGLRRERRGP